GSSPGPGAARAPRFPSRRWRGRSCRFLLRFLAEEGADRPPDVVLGAEVAHAHRPAGGFRLVEKLGELRLARTEGRQPAGLDVAGVVHLPGELGERGGGGGAVLGGVL